MVVTSCGQSRRYVKLNDVSPGGTAADGRKTMSDEYGADLVTVLDDEGNEHQFELLDAIETDDGGMWPFFPSMTMRTIRQRRRQS